MDSELSPFVVFTLDRLSIALRIQPRTLTERHFVNHAINSYLADLRPLDADAYRAACQVVTEETAR